MDHATLGTTSRRAFIGVLVTPFATRVRSGQQPDATLAAILKRVGKYVDDYERTFAAIVMEERQIQTLTRADGRVRKTRELRSDFLLIKTGPEWAQVFRDVIEVDGRPIRNRDERLRKLFVDKPKTAIEQAGVIATESRKHNIGPNRQANSPLLPMLFAHPRYVHRSRFTIAAEGLAFEEFQVPTLLGTSRGGRRMNLPAKGSLAVDAATGRILAGEFAANGPARSSSTSLSVQYANDPALNLMVPTSARERYWSATKADDDQLFVESAYANFRRFEVSTGAQMKVPK